MAAGVRTSSMTATAFLCLALAASLGATAPRTFPLERLADNGRSFVTEGAKVPLRSLDVPGLLGLPLEEQVEALNKAAGAGFNAVSFEAPMFGPQGFAKALGKQDVAQGEALGKLLSACARRRIYAFPVLWTPAAVDAMIGTSNARTVFWGGKNCLGWQSWSIHELAKLKVDGRPLTQCAAVGGWLLYRGPWPGTAPIQGAQLESRTPTTETWMRNWAQMQVRAFRKAGFSQRLGLGLWAKKDLAASVEVKPEPPVVVGTANAVSPAVEAAPYAALSDASVTADASVAHAKALDALPPVPGAELGNGDPDGEGEAISVGPSAQTPWDLEGLDWERVEAFFATAPLSTQVDFLEFTQETEDWYRVADRLAEAVTKAEVPVLWRQDWRTASRYERLKRLDAPPPLAGLNGPWPDEDWPGDGEALWPSAEAGQAPFKFRSVKLTRSGSKIQVAVELSKPADLIVRWSKAWPLNNEVRSKGRSKAEISLPLVGVAPGQWVLVQVKADTQRAGSAVARARWLQAPK